MKIGFEAKRVFHNNTGLGNYSRDLVRLLSRFYPDNEYHLYHPKPALKALFETDEIRTFEKRPQGYLSQKFNKFWRSYAITEDLKRDKIDIFHGLSGEIPMGLKKQQIKSVVTIHDLIFLRYPQFFSLFDRTIYYQKFKHAAHAADLVIAISEQTKADIVTYLGISPDKIKVVYQGCQPVFKQKYTAKEKEDLRIKYHLPERFLLNVGTIEPRKNILSAVKAIQNIDTYLVIVGRDTPYTEEVKEYISQHQLEKKVIFLKGLSAVELATLYQMAAIFIYPSLFEGFGIPIIEALFSNTPVITSKEGCFSEAGGPSSIYINPDNPEEIANAIHRILDSESLGTEMAKAGLAFAHKFQDELIAKELIAAYQFALNS